MASWRVGCWSFLGPPGESISAVAPGQLPSSAARTLDSLHPFVHLHATGNRLHRKQLLFGAADGGT
jgi:hypothetical protein